MDQGTPPDHEPARPNVLIVTCHDLGRHLGCYGVATVQTPQMDALAADGVRFQRAFCTAPQCSSSRASLFTGRYPHSNGVMGLTHSGFGWDLHPEERHLGQVLRAAGFTTALVGIHHESRSVDPAEIAARCGLDVLVPPGPGDRMTDRALALLAGYAEGRRPFFLHVGYHEPHRAPHPDEIGFMGFLGEGVVPDLERGVTVPPYLRDEPSARVELAELQGAIRSVDSTIGRLLAGLGALGLERETLLVVTTDHGLAVPRAKCSLYDPGIEAALIVRFPARGWVGGRTPEALVSNIDLFPTVLNVVGLPIAPAVQGRDLRRVLDGTANRHRDHVHAEMTEHDYYDPQRCVRTERHKLIVNFAAAPAFMDPSQSWCPRCRPVFPDDPATAYHPPVELYDLTTDPLERTNLADDPDQTPVRDDLMALLRDWMVTTGDPLLEGAVTPPAHRRAVGLLRTAPTKQGG
ncbi:MAG: Sulfatase family protein [uncultured Thermomicrobiales bacterium]|uniref:Sulfatase family protein n=1 Tax=uncultured Thermomicrobiales bacterium TaxID=1645740 RepID=A0A6J4UXN2_9BACT|nr:MAG: Sulfatase family protein [uncultured Thermomicrobiales bacterium]